MSAFKKSISLALIAGTLTTAVPTSSNALICNSGTCDNETILGALVLTLLVFPVGILLLDTPAGRTAQFTSITPEQARTAGLSADEYNAYSQDLDEVNAVQQSIEARAQEAFRGVTPTSASARQFLSAQWSDAQASSALSPETVSAVKKIAHLN